MDHNRLSRDHLKLLLLFYNLFLFFNLNFLGSSITTEKVSIQTDEIVDSASKLIGSTKTLSFNDGELDLIKTAPEGSFLKRLSGKEYLGC